MYYRLEVIRWLRAITADMGHDPANTLAKYLVKKEIQGDRLTLSSIGTLLEIDGFMIKYPLKVRPVPSVLVFHDEAFTKNPMGDKDPEFEKLSFIASVQTSDVEEAYSLTQNDTSFKHYSEDERLFSISQESRSTSVGDLLYSELHQEWYVVSRIGMRQLDGAAGATNGMAINNEAYYSPLLAKYSDVLETIDGLIRGEGSSVEPKDAAPEKVIPAREVGPEDIPGKSFFLNF